MLLTDKNRVYGFAKCVCCERIRDLSQFKVWEENGDFHRADKCNKCERKEENSKHKCAKDWIDELKDVPCADCGKRFPAVCMDFDHKPGFKKCFNVSGAITRNRHRVLEEIGKCDVVCACCHRIRTRNRNYPGTGRPCL